MIAQISSIEVEEQISPGGKFALRRRLVSEALRAQDPDDREAPFDIEFAQLPPGKCNYPHHSHATEWELYYALSGAAMLRVDLPRSRAARFVQGHKTRTLLESCIPT